jgi:hypothetical protein
MCELLQSSEIVTETPNKYLELTISVTRIPYSWQYYICFILPLLYVTLSKHYCNDFRYLEQLQHPKLIML